MSRVRAKRLQPLLHIAKNAAQEALAQVGNVQQQLDAEKEQKQTLLQYQLEYQQRFNSEGAAGISAMQLSQFESFILQIDQVLDAQVSKIQHLQQQLLKAQEIYQQLNQRLKSYEKLAQRLNDQSLVKEEKQLQNLLDEMGAQLHRRNHRD